MQREGQVDAEMAIAEGLDAALQFVLRNPLRNVAHRLVDAARGLAAAPRDRKLGERLALRRQRLGQGPEHPRQLDDGQLFEVHHRNPHRNAKQTDADDRSGIDPLDHDVRGRAEIWRAIVDREVRGYPARVMRRTGMEIIGAEAEPFENSGRHDHRRDEADQPGAGKQRRVERLQVFERMGPRGYPAAGDDRAATDARATCSTGPVSKMTVSNMQDRWRKKPRRKTNVEETRRRKRRQAVTSTRLADVDVALAVVVALVDEVVDAD